MPILPASYSKLSCWERCPQQAKYRYVMMLQTPKSAPMARGSNLHDSAEGFLKKYKNTIHKELTPIKDVLLDVRKKGAYVEHKIAFDHDFQHVVDWKNKKAWFRMVLDSAYTEKVTAYVQEWKSGKVYDDHEDQRNLYGIGALMSWDVENTEVTTYYMDQRISDGKTLTKTLRLEQRHVKLVAWRFAERVEAMGRDKVFPPRPGYYCRWCDFSKYKGGPCRVG